MIHPPVIAFTGPSGSGKTTLLEKLIVRLKARGLRVGAIKRTHHKIDLDKEGKDSRRFRDAGSNPTLIIGDGFLGYMEMTREPISVGRLAAYFSGKADIIVIEGFKNEAVLRFDFAEPSSSVSQDHAMNDKLLGFITDKKPAGSTSAKPVFCRDDVDLLAGWIIENVLMKQSISGY